MGLNAVPCRMQSVQTNVDALKCRVHSTKSIQFECTIYATSINIRIRSLYAQLCIRFNRTQFYGKESNFFD